MQENPKPDEETSIFGFIGFIIICGIFFGIIFGVFFGILWFYEDQVQWWQERKACAEWRGSFLDRRLIEIVRKDVDGQTFEQIGDFYGVSGGCIEKRINEDRGLYDQLKAQYISRNY